MIDESIITQGNFVIIGNGFDIECGLKTKYTDFLLFLMAIDDVISTLEINDVDENEDEDDFRIRIQCITDKAYTDIPEKIKKALIDANDLKHTWQPVIQNYWYKHFTNIKKKRNGWVDFENEISRVIRFFEIGMYTPGILPVEIDDIVQFEDNSDFFNLFKSVLEELPHSNIKNNSTWINYYNGFTYRDLRDVLLNDLNKFIMGFEIYLRDYVSLIKPKITSSIDFLIDKLRGRKAFVLTFNYTNTFEKILNEAKIDSEFCYIHGKVSDSEKNNMVLGIAEHLRPEEVPDYIAFSPFRKYNQRIFKGTDSKYMNWINAINDRPEINRRLYIFGHSLGKSDAEVLKSFIDRGNMYTTVFCHDDDALSQCINNMTVIVGIEKMILRNGGKNPTMEFIKQ